MILIVGLGNPGIRYQRTRHNVGFMVVEELLKTLAPVEKSRWEKVGGAKAETARLQDLVLVKPQTFMNNCGWAVAKLVSNLAIKQPASPAGGLSDLWIIHDDLDLPLGKIKIRQGGGTAGHHGLESIAKLLGTTDFVRFRLGIGKPKGHDEWGKVNVKRKEIEDYVLSEFLPKEHDEVRKMIKKAVEVIRVSLKDGLGKAMNRYNQ